MKLRKAYAEERQIWSTTSTSIANKAKQKTKTKNYRSNSCCLFPLLQSLQFVTFFCLILFFFSFLSFLLLLFFFFLQCSLEPLIKAWKDSLHYLVRLRGCCSLRFRLISLSVLRSFCFTGRDPTL